MANRSAPAEKGQGPPAGAFDHLAGALYASSEEARSSIWAPVCILAPNHSILESPGTPLLTSSHGYSLATTGR